MLIVFHMFNYTESKSLENISWTTSETAEAIGTSLRSFSLYRQNNISTVNCKIKSSTGLLQMKCTFWKICEQTICPTNVKTDYIGKIMQRVLFCKLASDVVHSDTACVTPNIL
jgi:hypothetical protein